MARLLLGEAQSTLLSSSATGDFLAAKSPLSLPMNIQLVDSLVQIIEALTPEENALLQEKLQVRTIQVTPGVCGGAARIRNTRIPVWTLVSFRLQGADEAEILRNYPALTPLDLSSAWIYYNSHRQEIDALIADIQEEDAVD